MSFEIEARIENGQPSLRILDAGSRTVRLAWSCPHCDEPCSGPEGLALQRLFRELFLLSLIQKLTDPCPSPRRKPGSSVCRQSLDSGPGLRRGKLLSRRNDEIKSTHPLCR